MCEFLISPYSKDIFYSLTFSSFFFKQKERCEADDVSFSGPLTVMFTVLHHASHVYDME